MYDGLFAGVLLITTVVAFVGLFSGQAFLSVLFFIGAGAWVWHTVAEENRAKNSPEEQEMMAAYRKQFPYWTDEQIYEYRRQKWKELQDKVNHRK
jgi:hypothetical protein